MGKYNTTTKGSKKTTNLAGGSAYKLNDKLALYSLACTSLMSDKYYESENSQLARLRSLIKKVSPEFVGKLAVYCREQMNLRTLPVVMSVELAKVHNGSDLVSKVVNRVIKRPDEITEMLAYYQNVNKRKGSKKLNKVSKQILKGIANSFDKFDEYQLAKYNRNGEVKLRDALFLSHPKPKSEEQAKLFKALAEDNLKTPETWETKLSSAGKTGESKKDSWESLIMNKKLGYMATLRNLRNILEANVSDEAIKSVCSYLTNEKAVLNSKQFPFRFLAAYKELEYVGNIKTSKIMRALEKAMEISIQNIPIFDNSENILIASDVSGSMSHNLSGNSKMRMVDVGLILSNLLSLRYENVITGVFGTDWKIKHFSGDVLANASKDYGREVGHGTDGYKVLKWANDSGESFDKICIFTDMQMYDSRSYSRNTEQTVKKQWAKYKKKNPNAKLYVFDLQGYGQAPIDTNEKDVYLIAGWSEKIFQILESFDKGELALSVINEIEL